MLFVWTSDTSQTYLVYEYVSGGGANGGKALTDHEGQQEAPDGEEATRVPHVMQGHRRLHQPLATPNGRAELVAHGQDGEPFPGRPVFAVGHGFDLGEAGGEIERPPGRSLLEDTRYQVPHIHWDRYLKDALLRAAVLERYHTSCGRY